MLEQRLNTSTRVAVGIGGIPETLKNAAWDMFVLFYFTQVLQLSGTLAGIALGFALAFNAIIDPSIGAIGDAMKIGGRWGRRQRMMLYAILPFAIAFAMLFSPPNGLDPIGKFLWLMVLAVICRTGISMFTIPLYALNIELSRDRIERPVLTAFRVVATNSARMTFPLIAFTIFFKSTPDYPNGQLNPAAYGPFAMSISGICILLMLGAVIGTNKRSRAIEQHTATPHTGHGMSPRETVGQIIEACRTTPNVRYQIYLTIFAFICLGVLSVYLLHLSTYYWRLTPAQIGTVGFAAGPGGIVASLLARFYVPYFDKKKMMLGLIWAYALSVLIPILGPMTPLFPAIGSTGLVIALCASKLLAGVFYGAFLMVNATAYADIADELELNVGAPRQGLMASLTFFTMFAAGAVVNLAAGIFLDVIDFPVGTPPADVPASMGAALAWFSASLVIVAMLGVTWFIRKYDISIAKQETINAALEERYAAAKAKAAATDQLVVPSAEFAAI